MLFFLLKTTRKLASKVQGSAARYGAPVYARQGVGYRGRGEVRQPPVVRNNYVPLYFEYERPQAVYPEMPPPGW